MTLTAKDVAEIMRILEESSFDELRLEIDGLKLHLQRGSGVREVVEAKPFSPADALAPAPADAPISHLNPPSEAGLVEITAPLLGIFYVAPKPGEPPFIKLGSKVAEETVVGIIEVMKLMHTVCAGVKGEVVEVLVRNGAAVEYGETLMRVRPGA